nr:LLM class flavin-dependent oxidoreductase [Cupriavidus sp. D384]
MVRQLPDDRPRGRRDKTAEVPARTSPGFISPTLAARKLATLDHYTGGRLLLHIITGGRNAEQRRLSPERLTT